MRNGHRIQSNMIRLTLSLLTICLVSIVSPHVGAAQTTVVFRVDLRPQLKDSLFVPGRGDRVELAADYYPLGRDRNRPMADTEPADSIYTAEVTFRRRLDGQTLTYNFVLKTANGTLTEQKKRLVPLNGGKIILDPIRFNAYAR